jgi:sugar-phosphatase
VTKRTVACRAVLFDLDGVLVDSTGVVEEVWRDWASKRGLDGNDVMRQAHGRPAKEIIARYAPHLHAETEVGLLEEREAANSASLVSIAGARDLVESLPPESWAVVTSGTTPLATSRLRGIGLPIPRVLITADDVDNGKPDPEAYLRAAGDLGVASADCVVIEDAPAGIEAGLAAGMRVIAVTTTFAPADLGRAHGIVATLEHVAARVIDGRVQPPLLELAVTPSSGSTPPANDRC